MYRYRHRFGRRTDPRQVAAAAAIGFAVTATAAGHAAASARHHGHARPPAAHESRAAARAVAYARAQLGKPYLWGGTGPGAFDCSGLVMMAWHKAGVSIPRTAADQWATLPHVRHLRPGDLIYYAGSDGTVASPGHVVLYIGGGKVIQAYASGYPVMVTPLASVNAGGLTGYARPS